MSTLSKVFVILVFLVAMVKLGVDATLFAQRVDWKDKFVKEVNYHYQTQQIKNAEIQDLILQRENLNEYNKILLDKITMLDTENSAKSLQIANLQREFDQKNSQIAKLIADLDVYVRQLEVQITQIQEMSNKVEEYRGKLAKAAAERSTAVQELQYARQEAEVLQKSMGALEEQHISLARDKKRLEETIAALNARGVDTDLVSPKKLLEGKVTAVSPEIGLVVISIGRDDGVLEGNEFTIFRQQQFIAKITVERVDRKWSAGRVTLKKDDPRVSDDASNSIFISANKNQ